jgi:serine/threonine protein kinase
MAHPSTIGRFVVRRLLGEGAQSAVYLAFDPHLEREVAVKALLQRAMRPGQTGELLAEARTVGKLRHGNIVPVFEAGEDGGRPFLVFEYVEGRTLADLIAERGALPPEEAVQLLLDVLAGIEHAHAAGVLHRDLKPSNIMVDAGGAARVGDFGIASRLADAARDVDFRGTPPYMAPEYVRDNLLGPQADVYAAGLVLYELVCGRRAIRGATLEDTFHDIVDGRIALPSPAPVDAQLAGIIGKATARDPGLRYPTAAAMREALQAWLRPAADAEVAPPGSSGALEFLLRRMRHKADFPALSEAISSINRLTASDSENVASLSNAILKDFALTNKILRLVNAAYFRTSGAGQISTVSRAIVVLGFNAVRSIAISLLLFEHLPDKGQAHVLRDEFLRANLGGFLAKQLSHAVVRDPEEAFICAMFRNLGRLLAQYYFPEEVRAATREMQQAGTREEVAVRRALGIAYEDLGAGIAKSWGFPEPIVQSMARLPAGQPKPGATREAKLRTLSAYADELFLAMTADRGAHRLHEIEAVRQRFSLAVPTTSDELQTVVDNAVDALAEFSKIIRVDLQQTKLAPLLKRHGTAAEPDPTYPTLDAGVVGRSGRAGENGTIAATAATTASAVAGESGEEAKAPAADAQAILAAGIQDISSSLVEDFSLNDILRIILETMYRALGFRHVLLAVREPRSGVMTGRLGFGPDADRVAAAFRFPLGGVADVFNIALGKGVDLLIHDAAEASILPRIPDWYRKAIDAPTFLLLPMVIRSAPVALIYADRDAANAIVVSDKELALLRTLRNQAVLAIKQSS